jgi:hypothetical protein
MGIDENLDDTEGEMGENESDADDSPDEDPDLEGEIRDQIDTASTNVNWIALQKIFDGLQNTDEFFYFLRETVDELKICGSAECPIYPELHNLDLMRMSFTTFKTMADATKGLVNQIQLKKFEKEYLAYVVECKRVFSKIYALKTSKDTTTHDRLQRQQWLLAVIKEMNKSNMPIPMDFTKGVQAEVDDLALSLEDPRIIEERERFRKQMKEQKKDQMKALKKGTNANLNESTHSKALK